MVLRIRGCSPHKNVPLWGCSVMPSRVVSGRTHSTAVHQDCLHLTDKVTRGEYTIFLIGR